MKAVLIFVLIICFLIILVAILVDELWAEPPIWQVLMAEAVSEGYEGMYAVACVIRNRGGIDGFVGAKRKDLRAFCERQGSHWRDVAKRIEYEVFEKDGRDATSGARYYENVETFGEPYWARTKEETCKIGNHTFWK